MHSLHTGSAFSHRGYHVVETGLIAAIHWSVGLPVLHVFRPSIFILFYSLLSYYIVVRMDWIS